MRGTGVVAVLVLTLIAGCGGNADDEAAAAEVSVTAADGPAQPSGRVVNVEVVEVAPEPFDDFIGITGAVEADRDVTVSAEESGVIRALYVNKGAAVRAGQAIAKIDDRVLRAQHEQASAEAALAAETFERQRRLWEEDRIGSEMNYLRAKYGAETAAANARMLAARLERTVVRAPLNGMLEARAVEVGTLVGPGTPVARVIDTDPLKVTAGVPERYAGEIRPGAKATVTFDNLPSREFNGRMSFVGASVSQSNRTFPVEVTLPNPGGMLKPGMVAKVQLARGVTTQAIVVPREAVLRMANGYVVYVVHEEGGALMARATPVVTGSGAGNRVVVESGLQPGDRVIVVGQQQVANGDVVRLVQRQAGS